MSDWNQKIIEEFRANEGKVGGPFENMTLLLLHTTGAKSGLPRLNPVAYTEDKTVWSLLRRKEAQIRIRIGITMSLPIRM